ncbi:MAG: polyphosphate kinase 1, partial [Deltaproteobacteria bacterium]|nr:polyphosphate kinase 1 [Deltaproteobacteria bacterium]MBW2533740.1 polyphosphate kinase 1 [Deltaproteobacteria bacterium]
MNSSKTGSEPKRPRLGGDAELFLNREISALEFQKRVLWQARDPDTPLLERLRFLGICSAILDEFFEIRVAGLKQQLAYGVTKAGHDGLPPREVLGRVRSVACLLVHEQYRLLREELLPQLRETGIHLHVDQTLSSAQRDWCRDYFRSEVQPVLTPIGLDPSHPFPVVPNKGLNLIVSISGRDAYGRGSGIAVVQVPRSLSRLIRLPTDISDAPHDFVMLSTIIAANVQDIFPGMTPTGCYQFRVTRNSDLWVDEEEVDNLLSAIRGELPRRNTSEAVRLEVSQSCPDDVAEFLLRQTNLEPDDLYRCDGPLNLQRLAALYDEVDRQALKFPSFVPATPRRLAPERDLFEALRTGDVLLHHPYQSFTPVTELVRQAAADPAVLAIKVTLYRTIGSSALGESLIAAARAGKEVNVVIELRARFDEAANIDLATRLQEAGASVVYGIVGYKCHAKLLLIVRRERGRLRRYVHLGTGNYHPGTTRSYTDFGLLTADPEVGEDVHALFTQLTGLGEATRLRKLVQSPFGMAKTLHRLIEREAQDALRGRPCGIRAKMNSLSEPGLIRALYEASRVGVPIDLVVRGICCLRPG